MYQINTLYTLNSHIMCQLYIFKKKKEKTETPGTRALI